MHHSESLIVSTAYAAIGSELKQLQNTSWIATAYMLTLTSFQCVTYSQLPQCCNFVSRPLYGKLSDIFGRKTCLLSAYWIFAAGSLLCGLSRNMTELILSRGIAGIGAAGMSTWASIHCFSGLFKCLTQVFTFSVVSIIMSDTVPLRSRGTWQGTRSFWQLIPRTYRYQSVSQECSTSYFLLVQQSVHRWADFLLIASVGDG